MLNEPAPKDLDQVRQGYRNALDRTLGRRELFRKIGKVAKVAAGSAVLGGLGLNALSSPAEAGGGFVDSDSRKRLETLQAVSVNDNAVVVRDIVRDTIGNASTQPGEIFSELAKKENDWTYEVNPEDSTWHFVRASIFNEGPDYSPFLDASGRIPAVQGFGKILDGLPSFKPIMYHPGNPKDGLVYGQHAVVISKRDVPSGGYVAVFSRPDRAEKPESFYDRWELDTGFFSGGVNVKGGQLAQFPVGEGYFLTVGVQDRTDRLSAFYTADNPAKVEKSVVIFDKFGQPVKKFNLQTTDFLRQEGFEDKGNEAARKTEINLSQWFTLSVDEQRAMIDSMVGKGGVIHVDSPNLRLHWVSKGDGHRQIQLLDATQAPRGSKDAYVPEMRLTDKQYKDMTTGFMTLPDSTKEAYAFPGDIVVPQRTDLEFRVDILPRGTDPKEARPELILLIPPTK